MSRRFFTILSVGSLLLSLVFAVMWVRSYHVAEMVLWRRPDGDRSVRTMAGVVELSWDLGFPSQRNGPHGLTYAQRSKNGPLVMSFATWDTIDPILLMCSEQGEVFAYWQLAGFRWIKKDRPISGTYMARASFPLWSAAAVMAFLPFTWTSFEVFTRTRARRANDRVHRCRKCGYDLRATPDRCPECGTVAVAVAEGPQAA